MEGARLNMRSTRTGRAFGATVLALVILAGSGPIHATADEALASTSDAALALEVEHSVTRILSIDGDPAFGEYLGSECTTCHQASGDSSGIPPIRGLPEDYTVRALVEYKLGARLNDVMKLMTSRLEDEEIAALAAYFAAMEME